MACFAASRSARARTGSNCRRRPPGRFTRSPGSRSHRVRSRAFFATTACSPIGATTVREWFSKIGTYILDSPLRGAEDQPPEKGKYKGDGGHNELGNTDVHNLVIRPFELVCSKLEVRRRCASGSAYSTNSEPQQLCPWLIV